MVINICETPFYVNDILSQNGACFFSCEIPNNNNNNNHDDNDNHNE